MMSVEQNKNAVRRYVAEVLNAHEPSRERDFVGPGLAEEGEQHIRQLFDAFPDFAAIIEDLFGEGDRVVARFTLSGTHRGAFAGAQPTNRRITWTSIRIYRFTDGKTVESWAMQDRLGLLTQLGLVQSDAEPINWASSD
jgi:predicted ester cyclase